MCDTYSQNADNLRIDPNERIVKNSEIDSNGPIGLRPRAGPFYLAREPRQLVLHSAMKPEPRSLGPAQLLRPVRRPRTRASGRLPMEKSADPSQSKSKSHL